MSRAAIVVKADLTAEVIDLGAASLGVLQKAVDGLIQPVDLSETITMWVNEEGLLRSDLTPNPLATAFYAEVYGANTPIMGDVVFTGGCDEEGNTLGLTQEDVDDLAEMTRQAKALLVF